jgi:polysaccharide pyruvyl transferase WcaK-like protein
MGSAGSNVPVVYLYVPISAAREYVGLGRTVWAAARATFKRCRDRMAWIVLRRDTFDYHAWRTTEYTNRGDIAIRQAIRQILERKLGYCVRFVELDWGKLDESEIAKINETADLFVICGGGYVSADAATGKLSRVIDDVALLPSIRCPVIAFAIGYNSILEVPRSEMADGLPDDSVTKLRQLASACDQISCRDQMLADILTRVANKPAAVVGDPALLLDGAADAEMQLPLAEDEAMKVGLNFALHGPITAGIFRKHFRTYVDFLNKVQRSRRVAFHYFVHCETERIAVTLLRRRGIRLQVVDLPPRQMIAAYQKMDVVICQMLHASILAANADVPTLNIGYDVKNASFYELMGLPWLCVSHDGVSSTVLMERFATMVSRRREIASQIAERKIALTAATERFADIVVDIARRSAAAPHPEV